VFVGADQDTETIRDLEVKQQLRAQHAGGGRDEPREPLLCYETNGAPLPPSHGFPTRIRRVRTV
jgi:DMSO/TMAO reductase YedYZ molybdopterin-dependent catalytic subunit